MGKVEEVARAIWADRKKAAAAIGIPLQAWEFESDALRADVRREARAAIAAMREPTEVMLGAMNETTIEAWDGDAFWPAKDDCKSLFNAAIDAALSEDKEQG